MCLSSFLEMATHSSVLAWRILVMGKPHGLPSMGLHRGGHDWSDLATAAAAAAFSSSTLAWKIPWMEEPGGLQSMKLLRVRHNWATSLSFFSFTFHFHALEKKMATHSSVLAWRILVMGKPHGLPSMESHRVRHDWSNLAAAAAFSSLSYTLPVLILVYLNYYIIKKHLLFHRWLEVFIFFGKHAKLTEFI